MAGPTSFPTVDRIIQMGMKDAGLLQDGDMPTSEQYAEYGNRLQDLINFWQTQGLKLWLQADQSVTLVSGQARYQFKTGGDVSMVRPPRILQAYYLDSSSNRRPLTTLSRDEYTRLAQTTQEGAVNSFFVDKLRAQTDIYLWLVPDDTAATGTVHVILQVQVTNFTELDETMDFPQEWFLALRWGLADDICTGQPQAIMDRCAAKALAYRQALEDWDVEDASTLFQPNSQMMGNRSNFR